MNLNTRLDCVTRWLWIAVIWVTAAMRLSGADDLPGVAEAASRIRDEFARLDRNGDRLLELEELRAWGGDPHVLERDFQLFDFDASGRLSRSEFACLPGLVEPYQRGTMPDPLETLIDDAVVALDESYDHWDRRPQELVSAHSFIRNFVESITPAGSRFVTGRMIDQADRNFDGSISRSEGRYFLEQQLGLRLSAGRPLREPTGRLVRYDRFLEMDSDRDGTIAAEEFVAGWRQGEAPRAMFARIDLDGNQRVSYEEYSHPLAETYFDPILWFRQADTDLDASLSEEELSQAVEPQRRHLVASTLRSFDDDQDGALSLREYRGSMLGNYNYPWHLRLKDTDWDGQLSFNEFQFAAVDLFQLQRWYFFQRLDGDRDGKLSLEEFDFELREPVSVWAFSTTGDDRRLLVHSLDYPECGFPSVSPDGTEILLDQFPASGIADVRIVAVSLEDGRVRSVAQGSQPSWSADGKSFVCRRTSGIWILDAGGFSGRRVAQGHGPKWSPDGRSIAFLHDNGIGIFDLASGEVRSILRREDHPYQDLGGRIAWSPDSRRLAVLGNFAATSQLLILDVSHGDSVRPRIRHSFDVRCRGDLNWTPQGISFSLRESRSPPLRLMTLDPETEEPPTPLARFEDAVGVRSACLTPDGKWYIAVVEN